MSRTDSAREWPLDDLRRLLARKAAMILDEDSPDALQRTLDGAVVECHRRGLVHLGLALSQLMARALEGRSPEALRSLTAPGPSRRHPLELKPEEN